MKRKLQKSNEQESRLSQLLFTKSNKFVDNLDKKIISEVDPAFKPAWVDDDDEQLPANVVLRTESKALYSEKLKQKYETLVGTPSWAKLNKKIKVDQDTEDKLQRTVGHLQVKGTGKLKKDYVELKRLTDINKETKNEGPIVTCVEFHPKVSVSLVAGQSGIVSLFSISGDSHNKLHSLKLKNFRISAAQFTPDGSEAFIASADKHHYYVYDLVKAEPKLVQLPRVARQPKYFQLSHDGRFLAASEGFDEVYIICMKSKELLKCLKTSTDVRSLAFSSDSEQLYCYCLEGQVTVWDLSMFRAVKKFFDQGCITPGRIAASPNGNLIATGSGEGIVNIYETNDLTTQNPFPIKTISNLTTKITSLKFNTTSELLAISSGFLPDAMKLIHIPSYHVYMNFPVPNHKLNQVETLNFSPRSGFLAIGNNKNNALLYRLKHFKNY